MRFKHSFLLLGLFVLASAFTYKTYFTTEHKTNLEKSVEPGTWTDFETAVKLAQKDQKKILVDVYTDWCKWCKVMDEKTFSEQGTSAYLAENFHLAKFNAEQQETITFKGKTYAFKSNGRRGYHGFAEKILDGRLSYPSLVVFDSDLNKLEVIRGFKNPKELRQILDAIQSHVKS